MRSPVAGFGLLVFVACVYTYGPRLFQAPVDRIATTDMPLLALAGAAVDVSSFQYLGPWSLTDAKMGNTAWKDSVSLDFDKDKSILHLKTGAELLNGAARMRLTPDTDAKAFGKIGWKDSQISLFVFRVQSPEARTVLMEIGANNLVALYINEKLEREVSAVNNAELGANLYVPISLAKGENRIVAKVVSNNGPPYLRMSMILDQSRDFQAAWDAPCSFLSKHIYNRVGNSLETPVLKWEPRLDRLTVAAEVRDAATGAILLKKETLRNGNVLRDGAKTLSEGIYKIACTSNITPQETASEYFLIGNPRNALDRIQAALAGLSWNDSEQLNIEAQTRRAGVLFNKANYDAEGVEWQERVLFTLGSLAEYVRLKKESAGNNENIFAGMKGL